MPLAHSIGWFNKHVSGVILPFWVSEGFLAKSGLFCERMNQRGEPIQDVPLRAMVQARQVYVYSDAERTGAMKGAGERALEAIDTLLTRYADGADLSRGLAFSVSSSGEIISPVRDTNTHAFILFALASCYQLTKDRKFVAAIDAITRFIEERLVDEGGGGLFISETETSGAKLQNPMMHMLEAYLALHEALPDRGFLDRASRIVCLFRERLFQPEIGVLFEKYHQDWSIERTDPLPPFEPGHQFEWDWLLRWYDSLSGTNHEVFADEIWDSACNRGLTAEWLCLDEVAVDPALSKHTHRVWPHTEGVKAAVCRWEGGDLKAADVLIGLLGALDSCFLGQPFAAGWIERVTAERIPIADMVPASTLYHVYSAFNETSRAAKKLSEDLPSLIPE